MSSLIPANTSFSLNGNQTASLLQKAIFKIFQDVILMIQATVLFILAGIAEIGGGYLICHGFGKGSLPIGD
jgi:hypothetical protein